MEYPNPSSSTPIPAVNQIIPVIMSPQLPPVFTPQPLIPTNNPSHKILILIIVIVGLVLISIIIFAIFLLTRKPTVSSQTQKSTNNQSQVSGNTKPTLVPEVTVAPKKPTPTPTPTQNTTSTQTSAKDLGTNVLLDIGSVVGQNISVVSSAFGSPDSTAPHDEQTAKSRSTYSKEEYFVDFFYSPDGTVTEIVLYINEPYRTADKEKIIKSFNLGIIPADLFILDYDQDSSSSVIFALSITPK